MLRRICLTLAILLSAPLVGCSAPGGNSPALTASPGASGTGQPPVRPDPARTRNVGHNEVDTMYVQMTIAQYSQAVEASSALLARPSQSDDLRDLATTIRAEHARRISLLRGWLRQWGEPDHVDHRGDIPGLISVSTLRTIRAGRADRAAASYLAALIGQHRGALELANELLANGTNADVVDLAAAVTLDYPGEIDRWVKLRSSLP